MGQWGRPDRMGRPGFAETRRLYEVEVAEVDHEKKKMQIHFKGYSHRHDEWKDYTDPGIVSTNFPIVKLEKLEKPSPETLREEQGYCCRCYALK